MNFKIKNVFPVFISESVWSLYVFFFFFFFSSFIYIIRFGLFSVFSYGHLYDSGYLFIHIYHSLSLVVHICTYVSLAT